MNIQTKIYKHPDGGSLVVDYFPPNFFGMDTKTPIILFLYGTIGTKISNYAQDLCQMIKSKKIRVMFMGRRGFNQVPLDSENFMHDNELYDFVYITNMMKQKFKCKVFMAGVSAGSCYGARVLGEYSNEVDVDGFCSIGNPYNFSQVCFNMEKTFFGRLVSKKMNENTKKLMSHHKNNPKFIKKLIKSKYRVDEFQKDFDSA